MGIVIEVGIATFLVLLGLAAMIWAGGRRSRED